MTTHDITRPEAPGVGEHTTQPTSAKRRAGVVSWGIIALVCAIYGPMAIEYMWRFFDPSAPALWDRMYSNVVSDRVTFGTGSIYTEQHDVYVSNRVVLLIHTTLGGLAILIASLQFSTLARTRHPNLHRVSGRVQLPVVFFTVITAMVYLVRTGPERTFTGPAFHYQLWMIAIGTLLTALVALIAVVRGEVRVHQCFMALNFALLLTAPLLRISYLTFGLAWPDQSQTVANLAGSAVLGIGTVTGAVIATRVFDRHRASDARPIITLGRHLAFGLGVVEALAGLLCVALYGAIIGPPDRIVLAYVATLVITLVAFTAAHHMCLHRGDTIAASEWRVHQVALGSSGIAVLLLWPLFSLGYGWQVGFYCAIFLGSAIPLGAGFSVVALNRLSTAHRLERLCDDNLRRYKVAWSSEATNMTRRPYNPIGPNR